MERINCKNCGSETVFHKDMKEGDLCDTCWQEKKEGFLDSGTVKCGCGAETAYTGTGLCDQCWEVNKARNDTSNLYFWNELKQPPADVLKEIKAGRLKGMTDISPQWRLKALTETFGVCGFGWKYKIVKKWLEKGSNDQLVAFVDIELFVKIDSEWSEPIPGNGGSMFIAKESKGLHTSDEAFKMATTDALSVAMKSLGVAADVYMGLWNGSKYNKTLSESKEDFLKEMKKEIQKLNSADEIKKFIKSKNFAKGSEQRDILISLGEARNKFLNEEI